MFPGGFSQCIKANNNKNNSSWLCVLVLAAQSSFITLNGSTSLGRSNEDSSRRPYNNYYLLRKFIVQSQQFKGVLWVPRQKKPAVTLSIQGSGLSTWQQTGSCRSTLLSIWKPWVIWLIWSGWIRTDGPLLAAVCFEITVHHASVCCFASCCISDNYKASLQGLGQCMLFLILWVAKMRARF